MNSSAADHRADSMTPYWFLIAGVFVSHVIIGVLLFRWRFVHHPSIADSDWLTFGTPFFGAAIAYWIVFLRSPYIRPRSIYRQTCLVVLSFCTAFASFWLYMVIGLNTYGS